MPGRTILQGPSPSISPASTPASALAFAPTSVPAPAAPQATTKRTSRYATPRGVTPAVTRGRAARRSQTRAVTRYQGNSSNTSAAMAEVFQPDKSSTRIGTLQALDNAHQTDYRSRFSAEYAFMPPQICRTAVCEGGNRTHPK